MQSFDLIVIGQGYAGLTAANLAALKGLKVASIEATFPGGLVTNINELDPWPEGAEHSGSDLTSNVAMANDEAGVASVSSAVASLTHEAGVWVARTEDDAVYGAPKVIVASGARFRKLGVPGEADFFGRGVSECADCDGPLYRGLEAVIVGGGDAAFQEAAALTKFADKVTIAMRGPAPRARPALVDAVIGNTKVVLQRDTQVTTIHGDQSGVTGVSLQPSGGAEELLPCAGVFVFVGLQPNTDFLPPDLTHDAAGAVATDEDLQAAPGLWAIGAVRSGFGGLLSDARADAERAVAAALAATAAPPPPAAKAPIDVTWDDNATAASAAASEDADKYPAEVIANLKSVGRLQAQISAERGIVNDLALDEVVVHVGAPLGAIDGWVGSTPWQVWIEPGALAGHVSARIGDAAKQGWRLSADLTAEQVLDAAKDRIIATILAERRQRRDAAQARVAKLEAAL
jgi:thioredoxin reductase (NADPH)